MFKICFSYKKNLAEFCHDACYRIIFLTKPSIKIHFEALPSILAQSRWPNPNIFYILLSYVFLKNNTPKLQKESHQTYRLCTKKKKKSAFGF